MDKENLKYCLALRREIRDLMNKVESIKGVIDELRTRIEEDCKHQIVLEADYQKNTFIPSDPPIRVCEICGLKTEGWGTGFGKLADHQLPDDVVIRKVERTEIYKHMHLKQDILLEHFI